MLHSNKTLSVIKNMTSIVFKQLLPFTIGIKMHIKYTTIKKKIICKYLVYDFTELISHSLSLTENGRIRGI